MNKVFKYKLDVADTQEVEMPFGAKILTASAQGSNIYLWAEIDLDCEKDSFSRDIVVVGTGHLFDAEGMEYINTVFLQGLVFHVYEEI